MKIASTQPIPVIAQGARHELLPGEATRFGMPTRQDLLSGDMNPFARAIRTELKPGEATGQKPLNPTLEPIPPTSEETHAALEKQAQRLVSQAFFGTLLKQMHDSPFKSEMFSGGRGGEAFSSMYDQHLADRMARASGRRLAASIVKHIERGRNKADREKGPTSVPTTAAAARAR
jgi:hypothetical protein